MMFGFLPILLFLFGADLLSSLRRPGVGPHLVDRTGDRGETRNRFHAAVFRLARRRGGRITLSDVIVEIGLDVKSAEEFMDSVVDGVHVAVDISSDGRLEYVFPELTDAGDGDSRQPDDGLR